MYAWSESPELQSSGCRTQSLLPNPAPTTADSDLCDQHKIKASPQSTELRRDLLQRTTLLGAPCSACSSSRPTGTKQTTSNLCCHRHFLGKGSHARQAACTSGAFQKNLSVCASFSSHCPVGETENTARVLQKQRWWPGLGLLGSPT